jgi:hypothetical protein
MPKNYARLAAHNNPHLAQVSCAETQRQALPGCRTAWPHARLSQIVQMLSLKLE